MADKGNENKGLDPLAADGNGTAAAAAFPQMKPPGYFEGESMTRRALFGGGVLALGGIATAVITLPAVGFALGPLFEEEEQPWQPVGAPADFTNDNYVPRTVNLVPNVGEAGKSTVYIREGNPVFSGEKKGEYVAISTRCAHLGCPVRWIDASERFVCPCHGGVYDFQGKVVGGPPVRPLDRFNTRVQGGQVQLGSRYSVNSELKRFSARDPGEKLDGLWQYLWPKRPTVPSP
jgi:quinol---cytochrome c reductase iron-sulfur subunit, bacillus type